MSPVKKPKTESLKLGDLMVRDGILTSDGLQKALAFQKQKINMGQYYPLGQICVDLKLMTRQDLQRFLSRYHKHIQIGELMVNMGLINQEQLNIVLEQQRLSPLRLGDILVKSGIISESQLTEALSIQLGIPRIVPLVELISVDLLANLDQDFVRKHVCLPVHRQGNQMVFVMSDPLDSELLQALVDRYQCKIVPAIAPRSEIQATIEEIFQAQDLKQLDLHILTQTQKPANDTLEEQRNQISNLAMVLLRSALKAGANTIHVETHAKSLKVRLRVNGILSHLTDLPLELGAALFEHFKAPFSGKAPDQSIYLDLDHKRIEMTLSVFHSHTGENLVLYVYEKPIHVLGIENLGLSPLNFNLFTRLLEQSGGIILAVGLERSGRTTLMSASLEYLNQPFHSMVALNAGFKHAIPGLLENAATDEKGYSQRLQAMLSHDADVLMVSELKDQITADFMLQAGLQGKKVVSSLNACDVSSGLFRLMQLPDSSLLEAPLSMALVAQRLVRRLCENCKQPYEPGQHELKRLGLSSQKESFPFYRAGQCDDCQQGYKGVAALHEILIMTADLQDAYLQKRSAAGIRQMIRRQGQFISLLQDGIYKALQGITSIEEIKRTALTLDTDGLAASTQQDIYDLCHHSEGYL